MSSAAGLSYVIPVMDGVVDIGRWRGGEFFSINQSIYGFVLSELRYYFQGAAAPKLSILPVIYISITDSRRGQIVNIKDIS